MSRLESLLHNKFGSTEASQWSFSPIFGFLLKQPNKLFGEANELLFQFINPAVYSLGWLGYRVIV
jgi:hypothetical protein